MKSILLALAMFGLTLPCVAPAKADPVLELLAATPYDNGAVNLTAGWAFTTSWAITVTALDVWDPTGYGTVWIYDGSGHTIASATLTTADPQEGAPYPFYTLKITPVTLAAHATYYIAQDMSRITGYLVGSLSVEIGPGITYLHPVYSTAGIGQTPTAGVNGQDSIGDFGPDFDVPEPASITILAAAGIGMGLMRRRHKR